MSDPVTRSDAAARRRAESRTRSGKKTSPRSDRVARDEFLRGLAPDRTSLGDRPAPTARAEATAGKDLSGRPPTEGDAGADPGESNEGSDTGTSESAPPSDTETAEGARVTGRALRGGVDPRLLRLVRGSLLARAPLGGAQGARLSRPAPADDPDRRRRVERQGEDSPAALLGGSGSIADSPFAPGDSPAPLRVDPQVVAQLVEFMRLREGRIGLARLRLALAATVLGGARIDVTALGGRRLSLRVRSGDRPVDEAELESLVGALEARGLEVEEATRAPP